MINIFAVIAGGTLLKHRSVQPHKRFQNLWKLAEVEKKR